MGKDVLHQDGNLIITLHVDEDDDDAHISIKATKHGPDLSFRDDVAVVVDGHGVRTEPEGHDLAIAKLGAWSDLASDGFNLMIRVDEFFEGWDFPPQDDDDA